MLGSGLPNKGSWHHSLPRAAKGSRLIGQAFVLGHWGEGGTGRGNSLSKAQRGEGQKEPSCGTVESSRKRG